MANSEAFEKAAKDVSNLNEKPTDEELLKLYGLFKQVNVGDVNTARPGMLSLNFKDKAKWDAWNACKGKKKEDAEQEYIELANSCVAKYGLKS